MATGRDTAGKINSKRNAKKKDGGSSRSRSAAGYQGNVSNMQRKDKRTQEGRKSGIQTDKEKVSIGEGNSNGNPSCAGDGGTCSQRE